MESIPVRRGVRHDGPDGHAGHDGPARHDGLDGHERPIHLRGGELIDLESGRREPRDIYIAEGRIRFGLQPEADPIVFDVPGALLLPRLTDVHAHLREPGFEDAETVATGVAAAARGGFSAVCCMPNTSPPLDDAAAVRFVLDRAAEAGGARVHPIGCVSRGRKGETLADMFELADAGVRGFSDDGSPVMDPELMRRALEYSRMLGLPILSHCEEKRLAGRGCAHEGLVATRLGLPGIPAEAEEIMAARDIALARLTGGRLHICHVSSRRTVELVRRAREEGLAVTAEATPHHLSLTHEALAGYDTRFKMNPPLREEEDRQALIQGLREGVIDCIATDHAPHPEVAKEVEFDQAPFGVTGLETALAVCLTDLVQPGLLPLTAVLKALGPNPAALIGEPWQPIRDGAPADLAVVDIDRRWTVRADGFLSMSANSPFTGRELTGAVLLTLVDGRMAWNDPSLAPTARRAAAVS